MYTTYEMDCNVPRTSMQFSVHGLLISSQKADGAAGENLNLFSMELQRPFLNILNVTHMPCSRNISG
jgi:hypothetical protein